MRPIGRIVVVCACIALLQVMVPSLVHAQATLAGVVRDTSGAVLPGATVEASSSALIEKARTATSDGSGQYRITDLPPGTYNVTFTLSGFNTFQRQNVEVRGSGVIPINAEMRIGSLPVSTSQSLTVRSRPLVSRCLPSGEKAMPTRKPVCALSPWTRQLPVWTSQMRKL